MFDSCADLWTLFYSFRTGTISAGDFHHRHHLAVALCYASLMPLDDALVAFRTDLLRLVRQWGHERKYHETITHFWLAVAAHYVGTQGERRCAASIANDFVEAFGDKSIIERHYTRPVLVSPAARAAWIVPDLMPLP
jgi:hypothetical protein